MQVELEAFGGELDFERLPGLWRLLYTTAEDVVRCQGSVQKPYFLVASSQRNGMLWSQHNGCVAVKMHMRFCCSGRSRA